MQVNKRKPGLGLLLAFLSPFLWAVSGIVAEDLFLHANITVNWLVTLRMLVSGLLILLYAGIKQQKRFAIFHNVKDCLQLIIFTVFGMTALQFTFFKAVATGNAATATVLQYLAPILIIIFLSIMTRKFPSRADAISVVLAVIGTVLIVTQGHFNSLNVPLIAVFWGVMVAFSDVVYTLLPHQLIGKYGALTIVGWSMLIGGLIMNFLFQPWGSSPKLNTIIIIELLIVIVFGTMFAYLFYLQSLQYIEPTTVSVLGAVEPLSSAILSVLFLNISFNLTGIIGFILVIGVTFLQYWSVKKISKIY
ncbi:DMT family transporter [Leuconostoc rapi]|uniref:DMT family transporter n=1 Tax=Leuconostoc rapi TaxID=1406906 RepID=UPI00195E8FF9|nr:EamA family transporter [Leuconostoc rapi]MBM7435108.1 drug/metabolite transporter (DMT)-like permease [Leuconostoc rapi]